MQLKIILFLCTILIFLSIYSPPFAEACSVSSDYRSPSINDRTQAATYVLEVSHDRDLKFNSYKDGITVTVHRWYKGTGPSTIRVTGFGPSSACLSETPESGKRVIIFAKGDASSGTIRLNYLGVHDATTSPNNGNEVLASLARLPL